MIRKDRAPYPGFTLVELIIVIVILGIMAMIAMPKMEGLGCAGFALWGEATRANLNVVRETLRLKYSYGWAGSGKWPSIDPTDFREGRFPMNMLNSNRGINYVSAMPSIDTEAVTVFFFTLSMFPFSKRGPTSDTYGWWYDTVKGKIGAYSDDKGITETPLW